MLRCRHGVVPQLKWRIAEHLICFSTLQNRTPKKVDERKLIAERMLAKNMDAFAADAILNHIKMGITLKREAGTLDAASEAFVSTVEQMSISLCNERNIEPYDGYKKESEEEISKTLEEVERVDVEAQTTPTQVTESGRLIG